MASQAAALASSAWKFSPNGQSSASTSTTTTTTTTIQPPSSSPSQLPSLPAPPSSSSASSIQNQNRSPGSCSPNQAVSPNSNAYPSSMMPGM